MEDRYWEWMRWRLGWDLYSNLGSVTTVLKILRWTEQMWREDFRGRA